MHADKERCPTMHFPSVVHLAPRQNDLFDVYSRSLTLIKITASRFTFLSLSFSLSFFLRSSFTFVPASPSWPLFLHLLHLFHAFSSRPSFYPSSFIGQLPQGIEKSYHQELRRDFRFLPCLPPRLKAILRLLLRTPAASSSTVACVLRHAAANVKSLLQ